MKSDHNEAVGRSIRVGVFASVARAESAFTSLTNAGFRTEELTVLCNEEFRREKFPAAVARSGNETSASSVSAGGAIGGLIGGAAAAAGLATVAGVPVVVAGALAGVLTGSVTGGLAGVMTDRGVEKEAADFFDQAVAEGKILISVEPEDRDPDRLQQAEDLLSQAGAEPLPLPEG